LDKILSQKNSDSVLPIYLGNSCGLFELYSLRVGKFSILFSNAK